MFEDLALSSFKFLHLQYITDDDTPIGVCRVVSPLVNDGAAGTIYITSSSNGVLQSGAVEAIIENGGVLRRGIQL